MILRLALCDLKHDRLMSLCATAAMAAVVAPLLLLFSLRYGILTSLENDLRSNPLNLEMRMLSGYNLESDFFQEMRADPDVGFVVEMTRSLSVTADLGGKGRAVQSVETIPTAAGDPLLKLSNIQDMRDPLEIALSASLAEDLKVTAGDPVKVAVSRTVNGERQRSAVNFKLAGIVRSDLLSGKKMLMPLKSVIAMEDWRDGYEPEIFADGSNPNATRTSFARARIYASSLEGVERLSKKLRQHYSISDKLQDIENLRAITRVLDFIFITVAAVTIAGGIAALGGLIMAGASRRERSFALLRLGGMSSGEVILMTLVENVLLGLAAFVVSALLTLSGAAVFNLHFSGTLSQDAVVALLTPWHLAAACVLTLGACAALAYLTARTELARHDPAQALRES